MLNLPEELVVKILDVLLVPDLIKCRQICRRLRVLIDFSVSLEYKIELYAAHLDDGPASLVPKSTRLRLLHEHQRAWNNLTWSNPQDTLVLPTAITDPDLSSWELVSGILAFADNHTMRFIQLPSPLRGISQAEWSFSDVGFHIRDFSMDKAQDLLVIIEHYEPSIHSQDAAILRVYLRSLRNGQPHALARDETISYPSPLLSRITAQAYAHVWYTLQIYGNIIAIMIEAIETVNDTPYTRFVSELSLWDWKSGALKTTARGPIQTFCFLNENLVLVGMSRADIENPQCRPDIPSLDVLDICNPPLDIDLSQPWKGAAFPPQVICSFRFPPLHQGNYTNEDALRPELSVRTDYSSYAQATPKGVPFTTSSSDRLIVVTIQNIVPRREPLALFVRLSSLLCHIQSPTLPRIVSWDEWGSQESRVVELALSDTWFCYVHGLKVVVPSSSDFVVEVWDFNQQAVRRGAAALAAYESYESDPLNAKPTIRPSGGYFPADGFNSQNYFMEPTRVTSARRRRNRVFEDPIVTSLPYRVQTFTTPDAKGGSRNFMMTEDNLVLVMNETNFIVFSF